ncbi:MAG: sensor histidine kinase [Pseudomonadota bacterium]
MSLAQRIHEPLSSAQIEILPPLNAPSIADEAHHRIANSLQLLCATVSLEAREIADDAALRALARMQQRITAIAGVHRQLYQARARGAVDLGEYVEELGLNLSLGCPPERRVLVSCEAISVPCADATAIGMIISELVANACKYAYPAGAPGDVHIRLRKASDGLLLTVDDSGRGFQTAPTDKGLGHRLIASLAKQLRASFKWGSSLAGTRFEMFCPVR